jgi:hypothetical protein
MNFVRPVNFSYVKVLRDTKKKIILRVPTWKNYWETLIHSNGNGNSVATKTKQAAIHASFDITQITAKKSISSTDG